MLRLIMHSSKRAALGREEDAEMIVRRWQDTSLPPCCIWSRSPVPADAAQQWPRPPGAGRASGPASSTPGPQERGGAERRPRALSLFPSLPSQTPHCHLQAASPRDPRGAGARGQDRGLGG